MDDHASKLKGLSWLLLACLLGGGFALGLAPLAHAIPWKWEKKLANTFDWESSQPKCRANPKAQALLDELVKRLYPIEPFDGEFSIQVQIINSPVVNAYAALGGTISVNAGLLEQAHSAEEVAAVMAHEIGHIHHRHILQGFLRHTLTSQGIAMVFGSQSSGANWTNYFMEMDFSRAQEAEADEDGLIRLQEAHIDNKGFKDFFERMSKSSAHTDFLSDHPSDQSRIEMVERFPNKNTNPIMTLDQWRYLKNYCK